MAESPEDDKNQEELKTNVINAVERFMSKNTPAMNAAEMVPYVFANDKNNPAPFGLLDMFYDGVLSNTVGIAIVWDKKNECEQPILVGLSKEDGQSNVSIFPLAVIVGAEDQDRYAAPDGKGGYVGIERN